MRKLIVLVLFMGICRILSASPSIDNLKKAIVSGTIECYNGKGHFLFVSKSSDGKAVYDTIKVNKDGSFIFEKDFQQPSTGNLYLEFLGNDRCMYEVYMVNGSDNKVKITGAKNGEGKVITDAVFYGDYSAESNFLKEYKKAMFEKAFSLEAAASGDFKSFQNGVKEKVLAYKEILGKCSDKDFKEKYTKQLNSDERTIPFRFCWAKRGKGEKMDADPLYVEYVNSFDLNDMANVAITEQILRWKMGCNPTDENNRVREMKLAKELISNKEVVNKIAGDIIYGVLATGGGSDLKAIFEQYKNTTSDTKQVEKLMPTYLQLVKLTKGVMATNFEMLDVKGNKVNFLDVIGKGKVVYVDFWATWCGPCCAEIPFVEKLVEKYKDNPNIEFMSVSLDDKPEKWHAKLEVDKPKWSQFIIPDNFNSSFAKEYNIKAIPRFMVFDKEGKIISVNATRPSNPKIDELLLEWMK